MMTKDQIKPMVKIVRRATRFGCQAPATILRKSGGFVVISWDGNLERETFPVNLILNGFDLATQTGGHVPKENEEK